MVLQFVNEIRQEDIRILCQPTDRSKISKAYLSISSFQFFTYHRQMAALIVLKNILFYVNFTSIRVRKL